MVAPRILFVDDEPLVLDGIKRALRAHERVWDMTFVASPVQALAQFKKTPFDVVVSDLAMPTTDGIDLVLEMRKHESRCAFLMLTGTADLAQAVAAINRAQVFRFFTKPCAPELLVEGIQAALAEKKFRKAARTPPEGAATLRGLSADIGLAAVNLLACGVLVVDANARLLFANRAGGEILSERDGLFSSSTEILRASSTSETAQLHSLIASAITRSVEDDDAAGLAVSRQAPKRPLIVLICQAGNASTDMHGKVAVVFVSDPEQRPLPTAEVIGKLFALSPSESRLVHTLTEGHRLEDAAKQCGITTSTARTYLKQIFLKTGTDRQSELLKLVLTSPALVD